MNQLPTVIQFEILNFLHHFDRLEYCRVNKLCSEEFNAASRIITFRSGSGLDQFMEDEWFRDSIIRKLKDPSNQLSLQLLYGERPFHSFAINVKSLKTSTLLFQQFHLEESIIRHLALTPSFFNRTRHTSVLNEVRKVTGLKDLTISSFKDDVHQLPIIPQLERLEIVSCTLSANISLRLTTELKNLRCLKLNNCEGVSDVSSLGNIYELHIIKCLKITNITALNNNEIITIQSSQVEDYSQSFQYSRVIDVSFAWTNTRNIDFTRLEKVQRLKLDYLTVNLVTSISIPALPSTLTSLTLVNISAECSLPAKHSLRELIIEDCPRFSLDNMANIPSVSFSNCYQIKDWTLLQNNSSVMVKSCANFNSLQLTNVKILRVEFPYRFLFISDIGNITHLKLTKVITSYQESFFTRLLAASETLQEIELEIDPQLILTQDGKIFLQSFQQLSTIKKIIININIKIQRDSNQFKEFYHLVKGLLGHVFSVEVSSTLSKVHLLPHRENNDQRSYRNKNCNDQMSYRNKNCLVM